MELIRVFIEGDSFGCSVELRESELVCWGLAELLDDDATPLIKQELGTIALRDLSYGHLDVIEFADFCYRME